jgi:hypothetical protein
LGGRSSPQLQETRGSYLPQLAVDVLEQFG